MFCAISGEPPLEPVVSRKSGLVYEKRLILKSIEGTGNEPVTGEPLTEEDLVEIKASPKAAIPRPPTHTSIPALLTSLQSEYDAVMLELFTLRRAYEGVRQELAQALYANDSANRVVARLLWERDEARTTLARVRGSMGSSVEPLTANGTTTTDDADMVDASAEASGSAAPTASTSSLAQRIEAARSALSATRKAKLKRKPDHYTQAAQIPSFAQTESFVSMHGTKPAGVVSLDVSLDGRYLLSGGRDKHVQVFDRQSDKIMATLKGHTKEVSHVAFAQSLVGVEHGASANGATSLPAYAVSAGADGVVHIWQNSTEGEDTYASLHRIDALSSPVVGLAVHGSGTLFAIALHDGTVALYDVVSAQQLMKLSADTMLGSLDFHPDGALLAAGTTDGRTLIFDVLTGQQSASFVAEPAQAITSVHFSENGYLLASATEAQVDVWDLRKLTKAGSIALDRSASKATKASTTATAVRFDPSAQFLAVVAQDQVHVYANKTWQLLWSNTEAHGSGITACRWTWNNGSLVTASLDRSIQVFAPAVAEEK